MRVILADVRVDSLQKDMAHFDGCLEAIDQNSSNAKVFVLIHKMDLVPEDQRERVRTLLSCLLVGNAY